MKRKKTPCPRKVMVIFRRPYCRWKQQRIQKILKRSGPLLSSFMRLLTPCMRQGINQSRKKNRLLRAMQHSR